MQRAIVAAVLAAALAGALLPAQAQASPYIRYGIQDDAWLQYGPGTLAERLDRIDATGADLVRVTLDWSTIERTRGRPDWWRSDELLRGLHSRGIEPVVTLWGTPRWANGGRAANWAPTAAGAWASFVHRTAQRYPFVRRWLIWNEPNQQRWLRPTSPAVYTRALLNPAYAALHAVIRGALVGGGMTAPRGSTDGVSPVRWIAGMKAAGAQLDAYAHNPYALNPGESPWSGGCDHCETITMSTLERLLTDVARALGSKRIWLTEFGYQTNPPDRLLGVSRSTQARYIGEAALRAYLAPRVDMLVQYLLRDEPDLARWQSGLFSSTGAVKPSYAAFRFPLAERGRTGLTTSLWGQIRPGSGVRTYRLQQYVAGAWRSVGGTARTDARGFFDRTVRAGAGAVFRVWSPADAAYSAPLVVR
jgi:hypothetical protein